MLSQNYTAKLLNLEDVIITDVENMCLHEDRFPSKR